MTQYTVLIPKLVKASKMHDKARLEFVELTKYRPIVTDPATNKLKTEISFNIRKPTLAGKILQFT